MFCFKKKIEVEILLPCLGHRTHAQNTLDDVEGTLCAGLMLITCLIAVVCLYKPGLWYREKYKCVLVLEEKVSANSSRGYITGNSHSVF